MQPIRTIESRTVVLSSTNIDTDQIIPARFLTTTTKEGLGKQLFADWRYDAAGAPRSDFVLNRPEAQGCTVLVAGRNFGCGSSRERAVKALREFGIQAVVAPSFGEIFFNNCWRNGIIPAPLPIEDVRRIAAAVEASQGAQRVTVDLEGQEIACGGQRYRFAAPAVFKSMLLQGVDEIELTLSRRPAIDAYRARDRAARPWAYAPRGLGA